MKRDLLSLECRARSRRALACAGLLLVMLVPWWATAPAARAAAPPVAATGAPRDVLFATATVTGTVNPAGSPTSYYFQYGPTAAYGRQTSAAAAGSGNAAVAVSQPLSGLAPGSTYHYRVVATSAAGAVAGRDATFVTPKTPAATAVTGPVGSVTAATAVATGTVNPDGVATTYHFQYGPTAAYGRQTAAAAAGSGVAAVAVGQTLSGLTAGTAYHYRVVAVSAGGTVDGRDATFATTKKAAPPTPAPKPAPGATTGPATAVTTAAAVLTGTVDPKGVATSFYFEYGTKSPTARTPVASAGAGTAAIPVSAPISGLAPATRYVYRLIATGTRTTTGATRAFATPRIPLGLSLAPSANPVRAGASVTFTGAVSGTGAGVRTVALEVDPYPYTAGFVRFGNPEVTSASGAFSFILPGLAANARVRAVTLSGAPVLVSRVIGMRVYVRVGVRVRRHGRSARFSGLVAPIGAPVQIRIQRRIGGRWVTIARTSTQLDAGGQEVYGRTFARARSGRYRVVAHVLNGSLLTAGSRSVTLH